MLTSEIATRPRPQFAPPTPVTPRKPLVGPLLAAVASGGLLWLCYFPADFGWLAWVALVPLLTLVRSSARPRTIYLCAWVAGSVFFWPAIQWMRVADYRMYFTWIILAVYCSLFFPLALYLIRLLDRRTGLPFFLAVPIVWTALEFFRSFFGTGFPWYLLAHTQHDWLPVIQIADVTGAWGVSFLVAAVNAFLCAVLLRLLGRPITSTPRLLAGGITLAAAVSGVYGYGIWRMDGAAFTSGPVVALVQGNLPQYLRNNPTTFESVEEHYDQLSDVAAADKPDLIVWPETSLPVPWLESWPSGPLAQTREKFREVSKRFKRPVLLGLNSAVRGPEQAVRLYNSALLLDGNGDAVARYDKIHRVPFGEYVPLRDVFPFMNRLAPYDFDYSVSPGAGATRFGLLSRDPERSSTTFGVVICYEDTDPDMALPYAGADGRPPANFILNISNDGWFDGTSEHEEHLAICRFRAVECRRAIARAVNMGISAVVDGNGRVLLPRRLREEKVDSGVGPDPVTAAVWQVTPESESMPPDRWREFKKVACVLLATVPLDNRTSVYARLGDWLPWSCWGVLGVCVVAARRKSPGERVQ
jgi:apolipoprotein N-acyltransferase